MKNNAWMGLGLVLLGAASVQAAQRPAHEPAIEWKPIAQAPDETDDWRAALSDEDLDRRNAAYDRLMRQAQHDSRLREMLGAWAGEQGPLGWTGRLALRELALRDSPFGGWMPGALAAPATPRAGGLPWIWGTDPFGSDLLRDMEEQLGALLDRPGGLALGQSSESFRMESGPDGVRVEVNEQQGDETSHKTYEAGSIEELYELHPELRGKLRIDPALPSWDSGFRNLRDRLRARRDVSPFGTQRVPTDKLGILMREPGQWSASVAGLDPDTGLYVERVLPGTLASELGLRPGDILVSLNGRALHRGADVQAALAEREPSAEVTAEVVDSGGERRELHWRPPAPELQRL